MAVVKSRPADKEAHAHLGRYFSYRNRIDKAIWHYRRAAELDPNDARVMNNLGVCYAQKGELAKAIGFFQKAVAIKPDFMDAVTNLKQAQETINQSF